jgi:hypothetical protein
VDVQAIREHCVLPECGRIMIGNAPSTQSPRELLALSGPSARGMKQRNGVQHAGIGVIRVMSAGCGWTGAPGE